jgi:uncharacterized lipoprotein YbaY/heat shock protein HslJ
MIDTKPARRSAITVSFSLALLIALLTGGCMTETSPSEATVTGTATYRERMALPAEAVFEATLEDVSRADAPAEVLGRARMESPGQPPFKFTISYDPARIDPKHRYTVRGRITLGDKLMFTTDTHYPVLGEGGASHVDLLLRRASAPAAATAAAGTTASQRLRGMYSYMADAGLFTDCATGQRLPVAQEADNAALEAAYSSTRTTPGAALLATIDGRIENRMPMEGAGPKPTLIVERFVSIAPGTCDAPGSTASLENTYWKLMRLDTEPVVVADRQREPHFILQPEQKRVAGSGGCNRLMGSYTLDSERLTFGQMAGTMMACPQSMEQERAFHQALGKVARWRIAGEQLELFDADGRSVAQLESRYLK